MKKLLLTILIAGLFSAHSAKGQERRSGNTSQRSTGSTPLRSGSTSSFSPSGTAMRQQQTIPRTSEWKSMNMKEKREAVSGMSVKERSAFLQKMKEDIVIDDIDIAAEKQDEFKSLYAEYQNNQKQIKEKFFMDNNIENLSNEEATRRLNQSFDVGQQLLNNRRAYADKFLKFLTPQQVLKLFQTEGKMRDKMLDKKNDK
ncbi:hypothetical protein [Epilithonimonas arachidiradicis]|uniref:LTXXQ motif family protein n=1 Tax=Epilithonimonas arachidiradicis TaxID=1617282 RepID=A0A420DCH0_9FLAO|nr:hypothetical protein [Epilithonimonas arachidiradicis]RKE89503.1 hypothetical protein BXY58_0066 [Epilithonimonas arachidiradicis]GGG42920.1 hypothetical protein GCM10007332_00590 [Epilithonimonas arachidiradicis]